MKKNKITFAVIIAAEIAAIVISIVVFNGLFSLWAVCLLAIELAAATMFLSMPKTMKISLSLYSSRFLCLRLLQHS